MFLETHNKGKEPSFINTGNKKSSIVARLSNIIENIKILLPIILSSLKKIWQSINIHLVLATPHIDKLFWIVTLPNVSLLHTTRSDLKAKLTVKTNLFRVLKLVLSILLIFWKNRRDIYEILRRQRGNVESTAFSNRNGNSIRSC